MVTTTFPMTSVVFWSSVIILFFPSPKWMTVNSQDIFGTVQCQKSVNMWNDCGKRQILKNSTVQCYYSEFDELSTIISVPSSPITKSCGYPQNLKVTAKFIDGSFFLNVSWKLPQDMTMKAVTNFLLNVTYSPTNRSADSGRHVTLFNVTGINSLSDEDTDKLPDATFFHDCTKLQGSTNYTVTVRALPSNEAKAISTEFVTNDHPMTNSDTCNHRWMAFMTASIDHQDVDICFQSAPVKFKINRYVLHVLTGDQYFNRLPRTPDNLVNITLEDLKENGEMICRHFILSTSGSYVALLQPNIFCECENVFETCQHTYINFNVSNVLNLPTQPQVQVQVQVQLTAPAQTIIKMRSRGRLLWRSSS